MTKSKSQVLKEIEDLLRGYDVEWDIPAKDDMVFSLPEALYHNVFESFLHQELDRKITDIKKALPTHKGKMLSRTEVKKILDTLNK
jgi:hypothetical protein